jgi:GWxTD domain-containing protein
MLGSGPWSSGLAADLPPLRPERSPRFTADALTTVDGEGRPSLSVSITVPYAELQWIKSPRGYVAGAQFTLVLEPRHGGHQFGDVWERRLLVSTFQSTNSPNLALTDRRTFAVPPGRYELRVQLHDLNSEEISAAREALGVPDYSRVRVGFAELELGTTAGPGDFHPVPTRRFGLDSRRLAARVILFDRRPGAWPRAYPLHFRVLDDSGEEVVAGTQEVRLTRSAEPVILGPDSTDLFVGTYTLQVELSEGRSHWKVERSFEVEESGPPKGEAFHRLLEPLAFVAAPEEIEHLRGLPEEEQAAGWQAFWKRHDPTPETARNEAMLEFLRRVRYVESHFQDFGPGWRSDMGRIYIKFGAPDQTESRPATLQTSRLEIWYYFQPRRQFVFADRDGFGHYVLVGPTLE